MNNPRFVRKLKDHRKKAISPVIATIILIAVALIMALVVGVFAFGLFSSNAHSITETSAILSVGTTAGPAVFNATLSNPTSVTTITVTQCSVTGQYAGACSITSVGTGTATAGLNGGGPTTVSMSIAVGTGGTSLVAGADYDYVISLSNGQSITGTVVAGQ